MPPSSSLQLQTQEGLQAMTVDGEEEKITLRNNSNCLSFEVP